MNKKAISQLAFEFLSIVFAVLLALGLNSYKQNHDLEIESKLLSKKILIECQRNLTELDSVIVFNKNFMTYLDSLENAESVPGFSISIASELLTRSAWNFTQASKSYSFIGEDFLNDATIMYEKQDYYMLISNQMFQNLGDMQLSNLDSDQTIRICRYYLANLNSTADDLRDTYVKFQDNYQ